MNYPDLDIPCIFGDLLFTFYNYYFECCHTYNSINNSINNGL